MEAGALDGAEVVFFDLFRALVRRTEAGFEPDPRAVPWLASGARLGVLSNVGPSLTSRDVRRILEEAGLYGAVSPDLVVVATDLPVSLPDPRVFAVAAALAGVAIERCAYVSDDAELVAAAEAAGMVPLAAGEAGAPRPSLLADAGEGAPMLLAGEIDEDRGPTFVLRGRVVTMAAPGEVVEDAQVVVARGRIRAVVRKGEALPAEFAGSQVVETDGTIYPGLIDLHNHFVYNVLPLWPILQTWKNRVDWPKKNPYKSEVSLPVRLLASSTSASRALVRYVEAKAVIGGTTAGQGMRTRVNGGPRLFRGAMRNVEETNDERLPEASTRVPNLFANPVGIAAFRKALDTRSAYFYHLAEGVDDRARETFFDLEQNDLLRPSLVGVHSLGLEADDLRKLAEKGGKVVWSPYSNLLLYGRTLDLARLADSGAPFSIGCDWAPTGSKNLLEELKVADWVVRTQSAPFTREDLVRSVTAGAASILGWEQHLGSIRTEALADLLVIAGDGDDPYAQLIGATEADVRLVLVHGVPRYGDRQLLEQLHSRPDRPLEELTVGGAEKALYLYAEGSGLNDLTFEAARTYLHDAMDDLPAFKQTAEAEGARLQALGVEVQPFAIELDNEYEPTPDELAAGDAEATLLADWSLLAESIELDPFEVNASDYWDRVERQTNLPQPLKEELKNAYA
jgi:5-methylthioadenosine/S-adenosylhomocysteine deaminase